MPGMPGLTDTDRERFEERYIPVTEFGCWLWTGSVGSKQYGHFYTQRCRHLDRNMERAHRVAYELYKGPIPEGLVVRHKCDVPLCVNPDHLELGTIADNNRDTASRGRHGSQKLSEQQVAEIRELRTCGYKVKDIAQLYGITPPHISKLTKDCQPKEAKKCQSS